MNPLFYGRWVARAALVIALLMLCVTHNASADSSVTHHDNAATGWIIAAATINKLEQNGADSDLILTAFDRPQTFVVTRPRIKNSLPNATPTQTFTSYADIALAFRNGTIRPGTKAILYDDERWHFTPKEEQNDPVGYAKTAAKIVHAHGLILICTPATDLVGVIDPGAGNKYDRFLALGIIGGLAKVADVVEVQAQGAQGTPKYAEFVAGASKQALSSNPNIKLYAGMSTNPTGRLVTPEQLFADFSATRGYVTGYWMNVPGKSPYCPTCGTPHPEVAIAFLKMLRVTAP